MKEKILTKKEKYDKMIIDEVAEELRVHRSTVSRLLADGELPYHNVRGRKLIKREDLDEYFENQRVEKKSKDFAQREVN